MSVQIIEDHAVTRVCGALGARVDGFDLSQPLPAGGLALLERLIHEHLVLVFPAQQLTPASLAAFGSQWGELHRHPMGGHPDDPRIQAIRNGGGAEKFVNRGIWHSDVTWHETPPWYTMLTAVELPSVGGDTAFANQHLAYEMLPQELKERLDGVQAVHTAEIFGAATKDLDDVVHPAVRTHPATGRKALYVNSVFTKRLLGMSEAESDELLHTLFDHMAVPEFCYRHRWTVGDLVMWDNRSVLHYPIRDFDEPRVMHRCTVLGDRPV